MHVSICSREEMKARLRQGRHLAAVISFYGMGTAPVDLSHTLYEVFQVAVDDVELDELKRVGLSYTEFFPEAEELAKFIFNAKTAGLEIICQCADGQRLSAGCAAAIRQFFDGDGIEVFANYHYFPNRLMYHKIYNTLIMESFERGEVPYR